MQLVLTGRTGGSRRAVIKGRADAVLATHQENGCCEPGSAEFAKNPAKICCIILREAERNTSGKQIRGGGGVLAR